MATELQFLEYKDALLIRATKQPGLVNATASAVVAGGFVAIVVHAYVSAAAGVLPAAAVAAALGFVAGKLPRRSELRVTNLEYVSQTFGACGFRGARSIPRFDVRWLEYQDDASGPESDRPGGLYAVLKHRNVCILPYLSPEQTTEAIERIATRFPDFGGRRPGPSAFGSHVISLGLDSPNSKP
jgi:hypothetical protein